MEGPRLRGAPQNAASLQGFLSFALVFCALVQLVYWRLHNPTQVSERAAMQRVGAPEPLSWPGSCHHGWEPVSGLSLRVREPERFNFASRECNAMQLGLPSGEASQCP